MNERLLLLHLGLKEAIANNDRAQLKVEQTCWLWAKEQGYLSQDTYEVGTGLLCAADACISKQHPVSSFAGLIQNISNRFSR